MKPDNILLVALLFFQNNKVLSDEYDIDEFDEEPGGFQGTLEDGARNWEERCLEIGGEDVLAEWQGEQENLIKCFLDNFDVETVQEEVEQNRLNGNMDEVFKKYCGSPVKRLRGCLQRFLTISHQCLHEKDRVGLNITLKMVDAAINFTCHKAGDRIALFMSTGGMDCVETHKDDILACLNRSIPGLFQNEAPSPSKMHFYVFQQENCRKGDAIMQCVEESLMHCEDPAPSNLVHSLLRSMKEETPCSTAAQGWHSGGGLTPLIPILLITSIQTLLLTL